LSNLQFLAWVPHSLVPNSKQANYFVSFEPVSAAGAQLSSFMMYLNALMPDHVTFVFTGLLGVPSNFLFYLLSLSHCR
jgi:hypothetical protein